MTPIDPAAAPWWQRGVLYQIYPRSFADTNGDGIGDLEGVLGHLDHLSWLGIDGIWLSPITVSPNADWGYDVADYCDVDPAYGTLDTLERLVDEAWARRIKVLLDLVPNHTSDQHPWFADARSGPDARHRDFYVWRDPKPDGSTPNNWVSTFGGPAWTLDEASGQYYLHNFLAAQPDLNWWNPEVAGAFDDILAFWWARGIAGFRIDVCNMIVKDRELRDNPPATDDDPFIQQMFGQRTLYNSDRPEVHGVLSHWRALADAADPPRLLLGETNVEDLGLLCSYYGTGADELHLGFNFVMVNAPLEAAAMRAVVEETERLLPTGAWPAWTGSNHDVSRLATRWAGGDPAKVRCALLVLLSLRGTPVLYQGDEIGLVDGPIDKGDLLDPVGMRFWPYYAGRDPERTPMPWNRLGGGGFSDPDVTPWLPMADPAENNVADQRADPASVLHFCHELLALRRASDDLSVGSYESLAAPVGAWLYRRGTETVVALNLSDDEVVAAVPPGRIAFGTDRARIGAASGAELALRPWEGVVLVP